MKTLILLLLLASCAQIKRTSKKNLVFIQGFHLDEHSWDELRTHLPRDRFSIKTLPRLESELLSEIAAHYCKNIHGKSILVAHSYGGAVSTAMYGLCPEKLSKIIFIAAIIPHNGELPYARVTDKKDGADYARAVIYDGKTMSPKSPPVFFAEMDPTINLNSDKLPKTYPESMVLTREIVNYDTEQFKSLPKAYIFADKDPVLGLETQKMFATAANIHQVEHLPTGHFPMISDPKGLAEKIIHLISNRSSK